MKFKFYMKNGDTLIQNGVDAEDALQQIFGRVTDHVLDNIERWEII